MEQSGLAAVGLYAAVVRRDLDDPQSSAERCRDDRISRYSPRALALILRAAMPKNKYVKASELIMKVEALAVVPVTV